MDKYYRKCRGPTGHAGSTGHCTPGPIGMTGPTGASGVIDCGNLKEVINSEPSDQILIKNTTDDCKIITISKEEFGTPIVFSTPLEYILLNNDNPDIPKEPKLGIGFGTSGDLIKIDEEFIINQGFIFRAPRNGYLKNLYITFHGIILIDLIGDYNVEFAIYKGDSPNNLSPTDLKVLWVINENTPEVIELSNTSDVIPILAGDYISFVLIREITNVDVTNGKARSNIGGSILFI